MADTATENMTTRTARIVLSEQFQARTEFLVLNRYGNDEAWFESGARPVATLDAAERAVECDVVNDQAAIVRYAEDRIADGTTSTNRDSVIARRRELREQARTRQYLIVSRDVPAFTPFTRAKP